MPNNNHDKSPEQKPNNRENNNEGMTLDTEKLNTDSATSLSDMASKLKSLEESLSATPEINQVNVNRIREKIARGDFEIDPGKIADKMLKFEDDF